MMSMSESILVDDFAPWLSRIERFPARQLQGIADEIPCEWCGERAELQRLLDCLLERRSIVRQLIEDFRTSSRNPFPNWSDCTAVIGWTLWARSMVRGEASDNPM